jgi:uncharacterized membrane protein
MSRPVKFLIGVLTVSVMLNFALAGFVAIRYVQARVFDRISTVTETEPSVALQTAFREALDEDRRALMGAFGNLDDARDHEHGILTAEVLDTAALEAAQQETRAAAMAMIEVLHRALRTAATDLPDAERRAIPKLRAPALLRDVGVSQ